MNAILPSTVSVTTPQTAAPDLAPALDHLRDLVRQHARISAQTAAAMRNLLLQCDARFGTEEKSTWYLGIAKRAPWLESSVTQLAKQHQLLRQQLGAMCLAAEQHLPLPEAWRMFPADFANFQLELAAHEEAERETCFQAYMQEMGTKD